jgi:hypothetical protein
MSLIPSSQKYADRMKELGISGLVFPLDEALGLNNLPFKMTIGAMLEIAKESSRCESYEEAEKILKEKTSVNINDDTMRHVTNTVGSLVFNNDVKEAESVWDTYKSATFNFSDSKKDHTLYFEVDGAMLPTRKEGQTGTLYRENKLGMAFSTDNIFWWTDKHGDRQHRILKREYTSYIGDSVEFTKLMLALAIRNGYGRYNEIVLISDGATWIRNMKDMIFPDAQQILDFYHLKEHITDYAKKVFNLDETKYLPWSANVCDIFKQSKFKKAFAELTNTKN